MFYTLFSVQMHTKFFLQCMHASKSYRAGSRDIQWIGKPNMVSLSDNEADQIDKLVLTNKFEPFNKPTGPLYVYHRVMMNGRMYF